MGAMKTLDTRRKSGKQPKKTGPCRHICPVGMHHWEHGESCAAAPTNLCAQHAAELQRRKQVICTHECPGPCHEQWTHDEICTDPWERLCPDCEQAPGASVPPAVEPERPQPRQNPARAQGDTACLRPSCHRPARVRGLCVEDYDFICRACRMGFATWAEMQARGKVLPVDKPRKEQPVNAELPDQHAWFFDQ